MEGRGAECVTDQEADSQGTLQDPTYQPRRASLPTRIWFPAGLPPLSPLAISRVHGIEIMGSWPSENQEASPTSRVHIPLQDTRQGLQGLAGLSPAAPGAVAVAGTPRAVKAELSLGEGGRAGERQAQ